MKKPVLILLALLSLVSFAQSMAQTPSVAVPASNPAATSAPDAAAFLASLSYGQIQTPSDQVPAPLFLTGCNISGLCPRGEICCFLCGNPPAEDDSGCWGCVEPEPVKGGGCPQVY